MIKRIELKRFKKFEHTTIEIGEFAVLVGENSSGKTSVLQAIPNEISSWFSDVKSAMKP